MIINRTASDVELAKTLRAKIQSGNQLTDAEVLSIERGTLTINTLNRIENKMSELQTRLNLYVYMISGVIVKSWQHEDYFVHDLEITRWQNNLEILKDAFYTYTGTPNPPNSVLNYQGANDVERILFDVESILDDMISRFRECGTFECGEANEL